MFITNKGEITQKTIDAAKKMGVGENVLNNKVVMTNFALGLENGLEASVAAKVGGLNEFGISVFLAAAQGNKKAIKELVSSIKAPDILFNCAGIVHSGTILESNDDEWDFAFNLNGLFNSLVLIAL